MPVKKKSTKKKSSKTSGVSKLRKIIAKAKAMRKMPKNKNRKWTAVVKEAAKKV